MEHDFSCRLRGDYGDGVCGKVKVEKEEYCERLTLAWPREREGGLQNPEGFSTIGRGGDNNGTKKRSKMRKVLSEGGQH